MSSTLADIAEPQRATDRAPCWRYVFAGLAIRSCVELPTFPILRGAAGGSLPDIRICPETRPAPLRSSMFFRFLALSVRARP